MACKHNLQAAECSVAAWAAGPGAYPAVVGLNVIAAPFMQ